MRGPDDLTENELRFLGDRHLGTLTTTRADGTPHVTAIAFSYSAGVVSVITSSGSRKARNVAGVGYAAVCQVDGPRWLTLEGPAVVTADRERVAAAVAGFERRYRPARENPNRVAIEISVRRVLGRS
jgi:PPOX class probable F420-dependent enzyme